jgi:hypothetical protein
MISEMVVAYFTEHFWNSLAGTERSYEELRMAERDPDSNRVQSRRITTTQHVVTLLPISLQFLLNGRIK